MDVAIALQTVVIRNGTLHVQAGGGIVADSLPAAEWQETHTKARALLHTAETAENALDTRLD
jgi:anthranilate synthase component 1